MRSGFLRFGYQGVLLLSLGLFAASAVSGQELPQSNLALHFEGNRIFSSSQLSRVIGKCLETDPKWPTTQNLGTLEYCVFVVRDFLYSKGYLQAKVGRPERQKSKARSHWSIPITEGALFRLGEVEIRRSTILSANELRQLLDLKTGDIADASCISAWLDERMPNAYKNFGYLRFTASPEPIFHVEPDGTEGVLGLKVTINEGRPFTIKSITFLGIGNFSEASVRQQMFLRVGDLFNKTLFDESLKRLGDTGHFESIDSEKDVDYRTDNEDSLLDIIIHLKRKTS